MVGSQASLRAEQAEPVSAGSVAGMAAAEDTEPQSVPAPAAAFAVDNPVEAAADSLGGHTAAAVAEALQHRAGTLAGLGAAED